MKIASDGKFCFHHIHTIMNCELLKFGEIHSEWHYHVSQSNIISLFYEKKPEIVCNFAFIEFISNFSFLNKLRSSFPWLFLIIWPWITSNFLTEGNCICLAFLFDHKKGELCNVFTYVFEKLKQKSEIQRKLQNCKQTHIRFLLWICFFQKQSLCEEKYITYVLSQTGKNICMKKDLLYFSQVLFDVCILYLKKRFSCFPIAFLRLNNLLYILYT